MNRTQSIFISYRSGDGAHSARLRDRLVQEFSEENVFFDRDRDSIPLASEFPQALANGVQGAEIFLAVIGPVWLSAGNLLRLADAQNDYVRRELAQAMARRAAGDKLEVLPLLVGGVSMPALTQLPLGLADFSLIQAHPLRERSGDYTDDMNRLSDLINTLCPGLRARRQNDWLRAALLSADQSQARFSQNIAVRAPGCQPIKRLAAQSALDDWWGAWAAHQQAFVLLGEEGDGKSWAVADWLADKLEGGNFAVPIVFAPALQMTSPRVADLLAVCLQQSQPGADGDWPKRLIDLTKQTPSKAPLFLLVVDAFNERTGLDWRVLFDTLRVSPWRERVAVLALCRSPYWAHLGIPNDGLSMSWTLPPFNDAELEQALAQWQSTRGAFVAEVLHLMTRPRYFDLAFRLAGEVEAGGLTLERLIYEDWRDMTGRKRQAPCSHDEFQALIADLAGRFEDRRFAISDFAQQAQGFAADVAGLRQELLSARVLDHHASGRLTIAPRYLALALGLVLAAEVEGSGANAKPAALAEIIAKRMGSYREADLQVRICGMALFHALNSEGYPEVGRLALLRAWVEGRNLHADDLGKIAAYLPLRPTTYVHLAEYVWGEADNREVQDAFMVGLLRHRELPVVQKELVPTFTRWLGLVYPWGYRAHFERDDDKLAESRRELEQRLGQAAAPGPVTLLGVQLEVVNNAGLLRLAQVAVAVISHGHGKGYARALLTGMVATAVMDGSQAEFGWVLHTCSSQTRQTLLQQASHWLDMDQPMAYLAARRLLAYLGDAQATGMQDRIPAELRWVSVLAPMFEDNPCHPFLGPWKTDNYQACLQRNLHNPDLVAQQLKLLACDPGMAFPSDLGLLLDQAGSGIDFSKTSVSMGASIEEHDLKRMEPALCAIAPGRYQYLMRAWMRTLATRDGLSRRQLVWHLLEHLPVLGDEEAQRVLAAWRAAKLLDHEHDKTAELVLFPAVVFDQPPAEQLERLTERGDVGGHFTQHAPCYRPLVAGHVPAVLAALTATESHPTPQRLHNLLEYLTAVLHQVDQAIQQYLLARFDGMDSVARGYCLELFVRTQDSLAAQQVLTSGWRAQGGRENYYQDHWGSSLLAEFGHALPFADLAARLAPLWLGAAVKQRGYRPDDLAHYATLLHAIWRNIAARIAPSEVESLSPYVALRVSLVAERRHEALSIQTDDGGFSFVNHTWGGSAGASGDWEQALDPDARIKKHNALAQQAGALIEHERSNGNPWFSHAFQDGGLTELCALEHAPWRDWIAPVLRNDLAGRQLLGLCRGFYQKLCAALLTQAPEDGLALFQALTSHQSIRITDACLGLPTLLMDAFAAPASPQLEQILRGHMDDCASDLDLFDSVLLCQQGDRLTWLRELVNQWQRSDLDYDQARALALLGFSAAADDGASLASWITSHTDCWLRNVAQTALQIHQKNVWARCWFERFLARDQRTEAWAAFRLFLRCVDRRFWLWFNSAALADAQPWKRDALSMSMGAIEDACKENEKEWKASFLGQKVKPKELWPWMGDYR